jgi:hypothetical protein
MTVSHMRPDIRPGGIFPDYALPDHIGMVRRLSELQGDDPLILTLAHGNYCPREHRQHLELAAHYPEGSRLPYGTGRPDHREHDHAHAERPQTTKPDGARRSIAFCARAAAYIGEVELRLRGSTMWRNNIVVP